MNRLGEIKLSFSRVFPLLFIFVIFIYDSDFFPVFLTSSAFQATKLLAFGLIILIILERGFISVNQDFKLLLLLFSLLFGYCLIANLLIEGVGTITIWLKLVLRFMTFFLLFNLLLQNGALKILKIWYWVGVLLSIQSILLFILVLNGLEPFALIARHNEDEVFRSYGLLGFANAFTGISFRTQSFFSEATNFAKFLVIPLMYGAWRYNENKTSRNLLVLILITAGILTTFSFTAIVAIILGILVLIALKSKDMIKTSFRILILSTIGVVIGLSLFNLVMGLGDLSSDEKNFLIGAVARGEDSPSYTLRTNFIDTVLDMVKEQPFGMGFNFAQEDVLGIGNLPLAPFRWLIYGGIPALFIMVIIHMFIIFRFVIPGIRGDDILLRNIASAVLISFFISLVHGVWEEYIYWLGILCLICLNSYKNTETPALP